MVRKTEDTPLWAARCSGNTVQLENSESVRWIVQDGFTSNHKGDASRYVLEGLAKKNSKNLGSDPKT